MVKTDCYIMYIPWYAGTFLGAQDQIGENFTIGTDLVNLQQSYHCISSETVLNECQSTDTTDDQTATVICQGVTEFAM